MIPAMASRAETIANALNEQGDAFKAFLAARVGSEAEAEDLLQNGIVKALRHADELRDDSRLTPWFYQLLRNAVVDHYRSRGAARRRDDSLGALVAALGEDISAAPKGWEPQICGCLGGVIDTLKPREAELLRRVELDGESVKEAAKGMKLTPNNASVMLHRARKELRKRLEAFCGACADGACLDCDCARTENAKRKM
jgi:RNA polymerase sigma-70 factor (ECF subfamily)